MHPITNEQLAEIFGKFAGKEVATYTENGVTVPFPNSPLMAEMEKTAAENNLSLRVRFPGVMHRSLAMEGRVTVDLVPGYNGKCTVYSVHLG